MNGRPDRRGIGGSEQAEYLLDGRWRGGPPVIGHRRERGHEQHDTEVGVGAGGRPGGGDRVEDRAAEWLLGGGFKRRRDRQARGHKIAEREIGKGGVRVDVSRFGRRRLEDARDRSAPASAPGGKRCGNQPQGGSQSVAKSIGRQGHVRIP